VWDYLAIARLCVAPIVAPPCNRAGTKSLLTGAMPRLATLQGAAASSAASPLRKNDPVALACLGLTATRSWPSQSTKTKKVA